MAMSKKSKQKRAESLLRLRDGQQQEFSLAIVSRRTLRDEAMLIIPDVQVYPCGCVFLLCQCGSRAPEPEFSESQRASIDLGPSASGCVYRGFNQLCMVTAYHQFDSPSFLSFYEQQTRACGLLHHPLSCFLVKVVIRTRKTKGRPCLSACVERDAQFLQSMQLSRLFSLAADSSGSLVKVR